MSEPLSSTQLKKRLLGAGILVLVAAVLIPFLLGEPKQLEVPEEEVVSTEFQSKIQPLNSAPVVSDAQPDNAAKANENESGLVLKKIDQLQPLDRSKDEPGSSALKIEPLRLDTLNTAKKEPSEPAQKTASTKKVVDATPKKAATQKATGANKTSSVKKTAVLKSGWAVQLGIFSKSSNAESFSATLRSDGYRPKISDAKSSTGKINKRVWLGPFATKSEAQAISKKFQQQTGNDGYVAQYPFK